MKNSELIPLSEFIKKINSEFPQTMFRNEMVELTIKKYKEIIKHNDFLEQPLTIEMFEGENKIFDGGSYTDLQPSTTWNYYVFNGVKIFQDRNDKQNASIGKKVKDICK